MKTQFFRSLLVVIFLAAVIFVPAQAAPWQQKVSASVLDALSQDGEADFLIVLAEQADISSAALLSDKQAKGEYVYRTLTELAERTQPSLLAALQRAGAEYQPYWIANLIWAHGDQALVKSLASRSDVAYLAANPQVRISLPEQEPQANTPHSPTAVEWNIAKVNADDVWAAGYTGQGVVVAGQDTGYDWEHPALINQYRGWNGTTASHDYNWHDAIHVTGSSCGANSPQPCDDHGHGTHTMGTVVGDDGIGNQVGMAPGARWIGCRNMNSGAGTPQTYTECFQWFVAPTRIDGSDARPDLAPDVINNSWGCPLSEGCDANAVAALGIVVENVRAAGIMVVASAGNNGPSCNSVDDPPAIYDAAFSVAATDSTDTVASFSSRGPADYTGLAKPDISAPGTGIRSAQLGGGYTGMQGTSMASPHVAGEAALLLSAFPSLRGDIDAIEALITGSAVPRTNTTCGGSAGGIPNNVYGWGRIDAWAAYQLGPNTLAVSKQAPAVVSPAQAITYTLTVTNTGVSLAHSVVLTDVLPLQTSLITATLPFTQTGDLITWALGDFAAGESRSVNLTVLPDDVANRIANTQYGAYAPDVTPSGDVPPVVTSILDQVALSKQASAWVESGSPITYTLTVTNQRSSAFTSRLSLTDALPANTTFITATLPYTQTRNLFEWRLDAIPPGEARQVLFVVQPEATIAKEFINQRYRLQSLDTLQIFNGPPVTTRVLDELTLSKQAPAWVRSGNPITYTLTVTNQNAGVSTWPLVLTDTLPAFTSFVTATLPYTLTGDVIEWNFASVAPGEMRQVTLIVQPDATQSREIVNDQYGVRSLEVTHTVSGPPVITHVLDQISLEKQAPAQVQPGDWITYTLFVTNNHLTQPTASLVLTDTIPANTNFVTATLPYTLTGNVIEWNFDSLAPGEVATTTLTVQVPATFTGVIVNSDYGLRTADFSFDVVGLPVTTRVAWRTFLPIAWK